MNSWKKLAFTSLTSLAALPVFGAVNNQAGSNVPPCQPQYPRLTTRSEYGTYAIGQALYWQPRAGHEVAVKQPLNVINGTDVFSDLEYDWGFRIGLGYNTPSDNWDIYATWTRFDASSTTNMSRAAGEQLLPLLFSSNNTALNNTSVNSIIDFWQCHLNWVDLNLARQFCIGKDVALTPVIGLRGIWTRFHTIDQYFSPSFAGGLATVDFQSPYRGIGIRSALATLWNFGYGLGLYSNAGIAVTAGSHKLKIKEGVGNPTSFNISGSDHYQIGKFMTDVDLGLQYDANIKDTVHLLLAAGFEGHFFSNWYEFTNVSSTPGELLDSDFATIGWTFTAGLSF